jgi:tetratricopeptide (TPR) repeat protein
MLIWAGITVPAFGQQAKELQANGQRYLMQNDFSNALIVLKKAAELEPANTDILNDLGLAYFMAGQYKTGYDLLKVVAEGDKADERTFLVTCMLLRGGRNIREADQVYRIGLQRFPKSGALHADYGEFLDLVESGRGIDWWVRGITADPSYPGNYYHASRHFSENNDFFWAALYGEIFVNLESYTTRSVEVKNILYDSYKRLYAYELANGKGRNGFEKAVAATLQEQEAVASSGINPEVLTAIRTRFILQWFHKGLEAQFPFKLFDLQRQLLREGIFDAYNQWLFGSAANVNAFQNWTKTHPEEYVAFNQYMRNRVFTVPTGQQYKSVASK